MKYLAELIGTFALVFCGTGAIIMNGEFQGALTHIGIAFTFGLVIMVMVYTFGAISGAHFNPAVTIGAVIAGRLPAHQIPGYIGSQLVGAFAASALWMILFPDVADYGVTQPAGTVVQAFVIEIIITFFLVLVILSVTSSPATAGVTGLAIGSTILVGALFAGPLSGASMNPARSIAPAVMSGNLSQLWIYIVAPIIGACIAAVTWNLMAKRT